MSENGFGSFVGCFPNVTSQRIIAVSTPGNLVRKISDFPLDYEWTSVEMSDFTDEMVNGLYEIRLEEKGNGLGCYFEIDF